MYDLGTKVRWHMHGPRLLKDVLGTGGQHTKPTLRLRDCCRCVLSIDDAHARPMHTIVQAHNSAFTSHPREAYELFATAAPDNTAKLWDVRSARCVRTFSGKVYQPYVTLWFKVVTINSTSL